MASSPKYKQLKAELNRLRRHFLPKNFDPTGYYSDRRLDRTRAYGLLAHAEIEFYIENITLDIVEREYESWSKHKQPSSIIICLLAACKIGWQDIETKELELNFIDPPKIKKDDESINLIIERAVTQHKNIVRENNGIKSQNIKRLLMPLGIAISDLDPTWINDMNSFGGQRGFIAHTSRIGLKNLPDPKTEKDAVDRLLTGLKDLDDLVNSL